MVDEDGAWPSYKLTLGSGELKLIATWHSLTPDPARSGVWGGGGGMLAPVFCLKARHFNFRELVSNQEATAPSRHG